MSAGLNPDAIERSMFDVLVHRLPIDQVIEAREIDIAVASIDLAAPSSRSASQIGRERALGRRRRSRIATTTSSSTRRRRSAC